jgi:hypothetical protein
MTNQDGIDALVRLWDVLPLLIGAPWPEIEPELIDALEQLLLTVGPDDREQLAGRVIQLCLPHEPLRRALAPAVVADGDRGEQAEPDAWPRTSREVAAVIERSSRPEGDQWLAARLEDHPAGAPVRAGQQYGLSIGVTAGEPSWPAAAAAPIAERDRPDLGRGSAILAVELYGNAEIEPVHPVMTLPPEGSSPDAARFLVRPRPGTDRLVLTALVLRDGQFIQRLRLVIAVEGEPRVRLLASGRPLAEARIPGGPDATLVVEPGSLRLIGSEQLRARRPDGSPDLAQLGARVRTVLEEIATGVLDGTAAHMAGVTIPHDSYQKSLKELVRAGRLMFEELFFGSHTSPELQELGRALQRLAGQEVPLWLEVAADAPGLPWHLLAFPDDGDEHPDDPGPARQPPILGLRHRVTYSPNRRGRPLASRSLRPGDGPLRVVLAVNTDIDAEGAGGPRDLVQAQVDDWERRAATAGGALAVAVPPEQDILGVLAQDRPPAELLYFYCHAQGPADAAYDRLGQASAALVFAGGNRVSLDDLMLSGGSGSEFSATPLVVLNACSTTEPAASGSSFLLFLLGRGARGVIGTEAPVPPVLAAAWAREFFARVLAGAPLADAVFEVARDLAGQHRNLLGLLYTLHCDGRARVRPPIPA